MLDLKIYTEFAQKMSEFSESMKQNGITFDELLKLDEICPISDDLLVIKNWWTGKSTKVVKTEAKPVNNPPKQETPKAEAPKQETVKKKFRTKRSKLTNDRATIISEYIATRHNDDNIEVTINDCSKEFHEDPKTIQRLLEKTTFVSITDQYFKVDSGKIVAIVKSKNIFGSNKSDIQLIKDLLKDSNYNVITAITNDMTANDIVKLAMVRLYMFKHGEIDSIGGGVKEILIMEAIASNRSANNDAIIKAVNKKYGVTCSPELVSAVRTGRSHKEIFARF
jgi:hypothetical protein